MFARPFFTLTKRTYFSRTGEPNGAQNAVDFSEAHSVSRDEATVTDRPASRTGRPMQKHLESGTKEACKNFCISFCELSTLIILCPIHAQLKICVNRKNRQLCEMPPKKSFDKFQILCKLLLCRFKKEKNAVKKSFI